MNTLTGYLRDGASAGARDHVFVLPSVVCSAKLTREIASATGAVTVSHQHGCGHIGPDIVQTHDLFVGLAMNPNVRSTLIASLGCETVQGKDVEADLRRRGHAAQLVSIQDSGGYDSALRAGIAQARELVAGGGHSTRVEVDFSTLTIGLAISRLDDRLPALIAAAHRAGASVVVATDQANPAGALSEATPVAVGVQSEQPLSVVRHAGAGAQLHAALAAGGTQVIIDFPALSQPPQGFPLVPVVAVPGSGGLHAMIAEDFDVNADAAATDILTRATQVFCGQPTRAESRGSATFAIPRLLRTM